MLDVESVVLYEKLLDLGSYWLFDLENFVCFLVISEYVYFLIR